MVIIVHTPCNKKTIAKSLGEAEYSYYFVLQEFLTVLQELATIIEVYDPETEVDPIYLAEKSKGNDCYFLSFSPPHKTAINLVCPTIPVLAWEFNDIPSEAWNNEPRNDWRLVLGKLGSAITHSSHSVHTIRKAVRNSYPVMAAPSPVWDRFSPPGKAPKLTGYFSKFSLTLSGTIIDSKAHNYVSNIAENIKIFQSESVDVALQGVIYTSVLNPFDGRKNWRDIITAFCWAFHDNEEAVLIIKFTSKHDREWPEALENVLKDVPSTHARIIIIRGYLEDDSYKRLIEKTSYAVNASKGEGQCLPLMEYMSAGTPAITPCHTGMLDYVNKDNSFIVESSEEPVAWPDDTRKLYKTTQYRISWDSLKNCYSDSYQLAHQTPKKFEQMSINGIETLERHCSRQSIKSKLVKFFEFHKRYQTDSNLP